MVFVPTYYSNTAYCQITKETAPSCNVLHDGLDFTSVPFLF